MSRKKRRLDNIVIMMCMCTVFFFNVRNISNLDMPCIEFDEFGYWTNGILFAGKNWSSITSNFVSYYSYGYGLILALIIRSCDNITLSYQIAILFNALMLSSSVLILCWICKQMLPNINLSIIAIFSSVALFYPSTIMNSQFAWSETVLLFFFLLTGLFYIKTVKDEKSIYSFILATICFFTYMIHQRSLGILVSVSLGILFAYTNKIIDKKKIIFFIVGMIVMFFIHSYLKDYVYENNWNMKIENEGILEEKETIGNDYSSQVNNILFCFTPEGVKCFFMGFLGKVYYMSVVSFFLVPEGIIFLINKIRENYRKNNSEIFFVLSLFFMIGISTVFLIYPGRIDTVIYGRYTDWLIPVFITWGLINVYNNGVDKKRIIIYIFIFTIYLLLFGGLIKDYNLTKYFPTCAPAGNYFRILSKGELGNYWISLMHVCHIFVIGILYSLFNIFRQYKYSLLMGVFFVIPWVIEANSSIENTLFIGYKDEMKAIVADIEKKELEGIYYLGDDSSEFNLYIGSLQFLLYEKTIRCIKLESAINIEEGIIIVPKDVQVNEDLGIKKEYEKFSIFYKGGN